MPRGRSLGVTQFRPIDDRRNYRRSYLLDRMAVGLGGRSAEELACEEITSGAQNDLQEVTRVARTMVTQLGMADELGPEYFGGSGDNALEWTCLLALGAQGIQRRDGQADRPGRTAIDQRGARARHAASCARIAPYWMPLRATLLEEESLDLAQLTALVQEHEGGGDARASVGAAAASPNADRVTPGRDAA